ncbi:MAG: Hpt domain-containing protein [Lachnospiraceae bacterium]|nr:Hpt domain-containing protein [Lachnospiraceae bacterium]MCI9658644.1 Hpt domain-containing protein [Lachnospiraceae bacterium]
MDLKECYAAFEGDYEGVLSRLRSEKMVRKFALKFLKDTSYDLLVRSLEEENYEEAFRAAHTIKGVCQNLGFSVLGDSSSRLTDALRGGWSEEAGPLFEQVKADYEKTAGALRILEAESEG